MNKVNIILENNMSKDVYSIFYLYNSKYYLIYTEKEIDQNGYVILYIVQVGKEIKNTPNGTVETGNMIGIEIVDPNEWQLVQSSITKIVSDKRNKTESTDIKYLPTTMLNNLKIVSKKTFRLIADVIENVFNIDISNSDYTKLLDNDSNQNKNIENNMYGYTKNIDNQDSSNNFQNTEVEDSNQYNSKNLINSELNVSGETSNSSASMYEDPVSQGDVIIDYRARFFEEQSKNEQLQSVIDELTQKLDNIKKALE